MCHLSDLISSDPALCSEVLAVANSPLVPLRFPVTSILQALARLGTFTLKGLCLTVAVRGYLGKSMSYPALRAVWRHSLATAVIARRLVDVGVTDVDDAHTAAIIHEIGRLALSVLNSATYAELLETHTGTPESMRKREHELFGFDHVEVGHHLVIDWALPTEFHAVIGHADPPAGLPSEMSTLIHLSCGMAGVAGFPPFAGCELRSFEELQAPMTRQQKALFYPNRETLASDIGQRIASYESL
jgi:HD-like signal output (HDOD) protein